MLVDFVLRTESESPAEIVDALEAAGINGVCFDVQDVDLAQALMQSTITGIAVSVYQDDNAILLALGPKEIQLNQTTLDTWIATAITKSALIISNHPYDRTHGRPWGDRVYRMKGLTHLVTNTPSGETSREQQALSVSKKRGLGNLHGSINLSNLRGRVATAISANKFDRQSLISALSNGHTLNVKMESADLPYAEPVEEKPKAHSTSDRPPREERKGRQRRASGRR